MSSSSSSGIGEEGSKLKPELSVCHSHRIQAGTGACPRSLSIPERCFPFPEGHPVFRIPRVSALHGNFIREIERLDWGLGTVVSLASDVVERWGFSLWDPRGSLDRRFFSSNLAVIVQKYRDPILRIEFVSSTHCQLSTSILHYPPTSPDKNQLPILTRNHPRFLREASRSLDSAGVENFSSGFSSTAPRTSPNLALRSSEPYCALASALGRAEDCEDRLGDVVQPVTASLKLSRTLTFPA